MWRYPRSRVIGDEERPPSVCSVPEPVPGRFTDPLKAQHSGLWGNTDHRLPRPMSDEPLEGEARAKTAPCGARPRSSRRSAGSSPAGDTTTPVRELDSAEPPLRSCPRALLARQQARSADPAPQSPMVQRFARPAGMAVEPVVTSEEASAAPTVSRRHPPGVAGSSPAGERVRTVDTQLGKLMLCQSRG